MLEQLHHNQENLLNELDKYAHEAEFHMEEDHGGGVATTCHTCLNLAQHILMIREDLAKIQHSIDTSVNPKP